MSRVLRTQYSEYLFMPTYVRKYLVGRIIEINTPNKN